MEQYWLFSAKHEIRQESIRSGKVATTSVEFLNYKRLQYQCVSGVYIFRIFTAAVWQAGLE
jgi:hypothetical protein